MLILGLFARSTMQSQPPTNQMKGKGKRKWSVEEVIKLLIDKNDDRVLPPLARYARRTELNGSVRLTLPPRIAEGKKCVVTLLNDVDEGALDFYIYAGGIGVAPGSIYDAQLIMGLYALIKHIFDLTGMIVQVAVFDITHCEFKDCKGVMRNQIKNTQLATAEEYARFSRDELGLGVEGAPAFYFALGNDARFYNPTADFGPGNSHLADLLNATKMGCYDTTKQWLRKAGWSDGLGGATA